MRLLDEFGEPAIGGPARRERPVTITSPAGVSRKRSKTCTY